MKKSEALGANISGVEVTNVSRHGLWILVDEEELFLAFDRFPWFRNAAVADIFQVERPGVAHLYWPALDVDLTLACIRDPDRYPLVFA